MSSGYRRVTGNANSFDSFNNMSKTYNNNVKFAS